MLNVFKIFNKNNTLMSTDVTFDVVIKTWNKVRTLT